MPPEPLAYEIDDERGLVLVTVDRQLTIDDWRATLDALVNDPRWNYGFSVVTDRRSAPIPDAEYVRTAIRSLSDRFGSPVPMRWASVTPPGPVAFGMGRMAELMGESTDVTFRVFQSLEEAIAWATTRR